MPFGILVPKTKFLGVSPFLLLLFKHSLLITLRLNLIFFSNSLNLHSISSATATATSTSASILHLSSSREYSLSSEVKKQSSSKGLSFFTSYSDNGSSSGSSGSQTPFSSSSSSPMSTVSDEDKEYDDNPNIFSPSGRLLQVEYAMRSIANGKPIIGIKTKKGIVLGGIKTIESHILQDFHDDDNDESEEEGQEEDKAREISIAGSYLKKEKHSMQMRYKVMKLDHHILCGIIGVSSDCYRLVNAAQVSCQQYYRDYGESVPIVYIIDRICEVLQSFTQGQRRPFGVSFLVGGYDYYEGRYKLIKTDAAGNSGSWFACYLGQNQEHMNSELEKEIQKKQEKKEDLSVDDACQIVCKLLLKYDQPPNPTKSDFSTGSAKESRENKDEEARIQKRIREMEIGILRRQCDRIFTLSRGSGNNYANENSSSDKNRDDENIEELMDDTDGDFEDTDIQIEYLSSNEIVNYCV